MIIDSRAYPPFVEPNSRRGLQVEYLEVNFRLEPAEVADWPIRVKPQGILKFKYNELEPWREWEEVGERTWRNPVKTFTEEELGRSYPVPNCFDRSVPAGGVIPYQDGVLRHFARRANYPAGRILEIGTRLGHSASIMAQAAPHCQEIVTIEPVKDRVEHAREYLTRWSYVSVVHDKSWDFLKTYQGEPFDLVFVDGNHRHVAFDNPWFHKLKEAGWILYHDWSTWGCWHVVEAVELMSRHLKRRPDFELVDTNQKGMAGFRRNV